MGNFINTIDVNLLIMIAVIVVSVLILKVMYRYLSGFKWLKTIVTIICILSTIYTLVLYIDKNSDIYSNKSSYFVYGKIEFLSSSVNRIELSSTKSSLIKGGTGRVIIKVPSNVPIYNGTNNKNQKIKLEDLKYNDTIQVWTKESSLQNSSDNELTAVKIVKKN